jgi:chemotaxis protein MotB
VTPFRSPLAPAAFAVLVLALSPSGCVTKVRYDKLVADSDEAAVAAAAKQKEGEGRIQALQEQITAAESALQDRDARLSDLSTQSHNIQAQLDEQTAMNEQLRGELGRLGKDVDKILADKGTLAKALDDAKARLEELRKAQAAGEARVALFHDFERRFKPLIDAGQLRVETRRAQLVLTIPADYLFDAGHSEVRGAGKGILMELAKTLQVSGTATSTSTPTSTATATPRPAAPTSRRYLVTANVDSVAEASAPETKPHHGPTARAPEAHKGPHGKSAWDLSAEQAVAVVEYLVSLGVSPESLTAAAAASYDPVASGDDPVSRSKNRRVEISVLADAPPP